MSSNRVRRALVSVFDKEGIVDLCRTLHELGIELLSSGGTARLLKDSGVPVIPVPQYTGFPEMLDGRVKTLHPKIHGGILGIRSNAQHVADMREHGIEPIDLVVVNLYPFEKTAATEGITDDEVIEMIDIGGPAMVRAAAKNHAFVGVLVDPGDYPTVIAELRESGELGGATRRSLAVKAFRHTSHYDNAVQGYLANMTAKPAPGAEAEAFPGALSLELTKIQDLRYGENPHQRAAFYRDPRATGPSIATARQLQGKELSFNNILDFDAALGIAVELPSAGCVIIKHGNPCGTALGGEPRVAFERALACDPLSAFGGVIAFNRGVDGLAAAKIGESFFEGVVAPVFDDEAREALAKKKNLRLLETGDLRRYRRGGHDLRRVAGGLLVQDWDSLQGAVRQARVVTRRQPTEEEWQALEFAWVVCKNVKSNAIVYATADRTLGVGAGQMSRVDSAKIAVDKAQSSLDGAVMASDAFFPFRDGIDAAAAAGIKAVVQPGGSKRDGEVIEAADEHGMAMVFTGTRHFRH